MHTVHGSDLSCQVCHSVTYTSCDGCHVAVSEKTGNPYFETENTYFTFLIGLNPQRSYTRPYKYVPLRHVPVSPDSFSFYGENLLPNFNAMSTWVYATPHNIQLNTPQTESCNACHGNADLFLTADKVNPEEADANSDVIVPEVPAPVDEPANP
jgi:thiosulfate/3-mercaptopyruvate sulfurtransferase